MIAYENWDNDLIELHKSIDWKARDYDDYPVDCSKLTRLVYLYGLRTDGHADYAPAHFQLYLRANPIYPPYYKPIDSEKPLAYICSCYGYSRDEIAIVGPMSDSRICGGYYIHDVYETQELYDAEMR